MATIKSSATTFTREYSLDDGDDKAAIKLRLSVPFDLAPERATAILDDMVQALEIERDAYLETRGVGRQRGLFDGPGGNGANGGNGTRPHSWRDREPAHGGLPLGDR